MPATSIAPSTGRARLAILVSCIGASFQIGNAVEAKDIMLNIPVLTKAVPEDIANVSHNIAEAVQTVTVDFTNKLKNASDSLEDHVVNATRDVGNAANAMQKQLTNATYSVAKTTKTMTKQAVKETKQMRKQVLKASHLPRQDRKMPPDMVVFLVFTVASTSQGMSGFGQAILWSSGMRLCSTYFGFDYHPAKVVGLLSLGEVMVSTFIVLSERHAIVWLVVLHLGLPLVLAIPVGNLALKFCDMHLIGRIVGVIIVLNSIRGFWKLLGDPAVQKSEAPDESFKRAAISSIDTDTESEDEIKPLPPAWMAICAGIMAGILGGCMGIMGPIAAFYFLATELDKTQIKATVQVTILGMAVSNTALLWSEGTLQPLKDVESLLSVLSAAVVGVALGTALHAYFSDRLIRFTIFFSCILASCALLGAGNEQLTDRLLLVAPFLVLALTAAHSLFGVT